MINGAGNAWTLGDKVLAKSVPHVAPHFHRRGHQLFFLISSRPFLQFAADEVSLFDSLDGHKTLAELENEHPGATGRLLKWQAASVVVLIVPLQPKHHPHILVIEPHMDDAALSVGGRLLHRRGKSRITILSVVKRSNFSSYMKIQRGILDVDHVTSLRQHESDYAVKFLAAEHCSLNWTDAPLRHHPAERWTPDTARRFIAKPSQFVDLSPLPKEISALAEALASKVKKFGPNELWIPLGVGHHVDHALTRSACMLMLSKHQKDLPHMSVTFYEDVPYNMDLNHATHICDVLRRSGMNLSRQTEDITDVFEEKLRLVAIYGTQFKRSFVEPQLRSLGRRESGSQNGFAETSYTVDGTVNHIAPTDLSVHWTGLTMLKSALPVLRSQVARRRRLSIIALPSGNLGRWPIERSMLMGAFPGLDLRVYAPDAGARYVPVDPRDAGITVVPNGWRGWVKVFLSECFHFGTTTVILWSAAYLRGANVKRAIFRFAFPFRYRLFARCISDLCSVMQEGTTEDK